MRIVLTDLNSVPMTSSILPTNCMAFDFFKYAVPFLLSKNESTSPTRDSGCPAEPGFSIPGHFKCCGLSPTPACQNLRFVTSNQLISLGFYFCQLYNGDNHPISWGFLGTNERSNASSLLITQIIINVQSITLRKTKAYLPATCG